MNAPVPKPMTESAATADVSHSLSGKAIVAQIKEVEAAAASLATGASELFELLASPKKFAERINSPNKPLAEKNIAFLHRAQAIWPHAVDVFGDESEARLWLLQTNGSLGGIAPLELLDGEDGFTLVDDTLSRIEHGIVS